MKERPILFSAPMVRALLDGSKTQTRRIAKVTPDQCEDIGIFYAEHQCPYGQPGDRLWVRETWAPVDEFVLGYPLDEPNSIGYRADLSARLLDITALNTYAWNWDLVKWKPSIHMPRWASRIMLEVTGVRVERLQDISDRDAQAEGVTIEDHHKRGYCAGEFLPPSIRAYRDLWEQINGAGSWEANPYVWAVEFKRVEVKEVE